MARARLLLDEDVPLLLAEALRARRHDVVHAQELHLKSAKDPRVLTEAVSRGRAVLTHNITDYLDLATHCGSSGTHHHGIVLARRRRMRPRPRHPCYARWWSRSPEAFMARRQRSAAVGLFVVGLALGSAACGGEPPAPPALQPAVPSAPPDSPPAPMPDWVKVSEAQLAEAARLKVPVALEEPTTGIRFVLVPGGTFMRGSLDGKGLSDVRPAHRVTLSPFYLAIHETTNKQYRMFKSDHDSGAFTEDGTSYTLSGDNQPAVRLDFAEASAFAVWLSQLKSGGTLGSFLLPSEAQWEYACRAATTTRFSFGDKSDDLVHYGNFSDRNDPSNRDRTNLDDGHDVSAPVGSYRPNPWGLYDMHGNVWEWCADDYHSSYAGAPTEGSAWIDFPRADERVMRGGAWDVSPVILSSALRMAPFPDTRRPFLGFRTARAVRP